jgi:uncharacterized membrane protein
MRPRLAVFAAVAASAITMLALDLTWLGVVARGLYDSQLGPLRRAQVVLPAAMLFYALFVAAIVVYAVLGAGRWTAALRRGAALGLVTYATYELTNWATIAGWPVLLVPVDIAWGVVVTALAALAGKLAHDRVR